MAKYKARKVEGNLGQATRGMAADFVNKGTQPNRTGWNEVDAAWFDYWVGRTELANKNNERLDAIDAAFIANQQTQITPNQQASNNDKAKALAELMGVPVEKAAFMMQMLGK
jgi:hypothetical protein